MGKYFGTDGFRGEVNAVLTAEHAFRVGRILGWYYGQEEAKKARIVIGKDTRRSGYMLEYALAAGLTASGADAYILHVISTPGVSFICRTEDFSCGVMISASHNRFEDNGIKLFNDRGEKTDDTLIALIEQYIDGILPSSCHGDDLPLASGANIGRIIDHVIGRNRYIGYLLSLSAYSYKNLKIGLDCANGSLWMIAKSVFDALGAHTVPLAVNPNGININDGCGSTHIDALKALVSESGLDIGFAFDGDGDRCLCVDETGKIVSGDEILYLLGVQLKERGTLSHDTVVLTVMSNTGAENAMREAGMKTVRTAVGDKNVYACMAREDYVLGGESCGHIICGHYANTGDGMVTALQVMDAILTSKKSLGQLTAPVHMMVQMTTNLRASDREKTASDAGLQAFLEKKNAEIRQTGGRILFRVSGTEPVIRLMVEHDDRSVCSRYTEAVTDYMREKNLL